MSEDINPSPTMEGLEGPPPAPTPETPLSKPEAAKKRLIKLGGGIARAVNIYGFYTTGGLFNLLPPTREGDGEATPPTAEEAATLSEPIPPPELSEALSSEEESEGSEETIEEDSADSLEGPTTPESYLRERGIDSAVIEQVNKVLDSSQQELIEEHLAAAGVEPENLERVAHLLKPLHIYLKRLHELGMPPIKDAEASHFLHEERGRLRLKHLEGLVGGEADKLRQLLQTHQSELLAQELRRLGYDDAKINLISATPRRNKSRLINEALTRLGLEDNLVRGVELIVGMGEVPAEIAERASRSGVSLEDLVRAREAFRRADWGETCDYLELAKTDAGARELLKSHGIEIEPAPETAAARSERLENMTLKEINEKYPEEWEAERDRRVSHKRHEFFGMLEKFKDYLPIDEFPLPPDVDVPPEESIPEDFPGAYGLWRRVVIDNYVKLLETERGYQQVLSEIKRVGGPPIIRRSGQKIMARRVLAAQKKHDREIGADKNYGAFSLGRDQYKSNLRAMEELDTKAGDIRRALDKFHRSKFTKDGQATPRLGLAEMIVEHRLKEIAYREGRLDLMPPHQIKVPDHIPELYAEDEESGEGMV